jgi:hypothetical protein
VPAVTCELLPARHERRTSCGAASIAGGGARGVIGAGDLELALSYQGSIWNAAAAMSVDLEREVQQESP